MSMFLFLNWQNKLLNIVSKNSLGRIKALLTVIYDL
jgi:hypothetical protein